ncbi:hypothetical protein RHMOL_Rhmol10G0260100 [Rhododendron molle]|uniref:Uncharacterized protein n=1 Tax=Rhododendron molle TaxID=49168 RepID=A0ACC0M6T2_RHOML|nr:hypothetical protein RHMOL_Rhmol10G0260100 [Rhododendron molle]
MLVRRRGGGSMVGVLGPRIRWWWWLMPSIWPSRRNDRGKRPGAICLVIRYLSEAEVGSWNASEVCNRAHE